MCHSEAQSKNLGFEAHCYCEILRFALYQMLKGSAPYQTVQGFAQNDSASLFFRRAVQTIECSPGYEEARFDMDYSIEAGTSILQREMQKTKINLKTP